eukprot:6251606-Lingulodinium_polyedra.AAC.1
MGARIAGAFILGNPSGQRAGNASQEPRLVGGIPLVRQGRPHGHLRLTGPQAQCQTQPGTRTTDLESDRRSATK